MFFIVGLLHITYLHSLTDVTVALADAGSTLSEPEGATFDVCVNITQDAPGGRECPIDVTLTYNPYGNKPGWWKLIIKKLCLYVHYSRNCILFSTASLADFSFNMTVTIPVDQSQACSSVSLTDDDTVEGTQAFSVSIQSATPPTIITFDFSEELVIQIMDVDGKNYSTSI